MHGVDRELALGDQRTLARRDRAGSFDDELHGDLLVADTLLELSAPGQEEQVGDPHAVERRHEDDGDTAAAAPREGFLAMLVASAAQASMASGEALLIDDLLSHYGIQPTVYD